ncbi:aldo/keto reductase [Streptomyces sp. NPDC005181]|uniref:aldo/keto reductase n=1 Tax=Streptomyces sp. NPDC005181 TaxID=3156869 RepID=UPI0033B26303
MKVCQPSDPYNVQNPLQDPAVTELADKYGKTPDQVILRRYIEHGLSPIPKSVHEKRIKENVDVFDLSLTPQEVGAIDALDTAVRGGPDPEAVDTKLFPFTIED